MPMVLHQDFRDDGTPSSAQKAHSKTIASAMVTSPAPSATEASTPSRSERLLVQSRGDETAMAKHNAPCEQQVSNLVDDNSMFSIDSPTGKSTPKVGPLGASRMASPSSIRGGFMSSNNFPVMHYGNDCSDSYISSDDDMDEGCQGRIETNGNPDPMTWKIDVFNAKCRSKVEHPALQSQARPQRAPVAPKRQKSMSLHRSDKFLASPKKMGDPERPTLPVRQSTEHSRRGMGLGSISYIAGARSSISMMTEGSTMAPLKEDESFEGLNDVDLTFDDSIRSMDSLNRDRKIPPSPAFKLPRQTSVGSMPTLAEISTSTIGGNSSKRDANDSAHHSDIASLDAGPACELARHMEAILNTKLQETELPAAEKISNKDNIFHQDMALGPKSHFPNLPRPEKPIKKILSERKLGTAEEKQKKNVTKSSSQVFSSSVSEMKAMMHAATRPPTQCKKQGNARLTSSPTKTSHAPGTREFEHRDSADLSRSQHSRRRIHMQKMREELPTDASQSRSRSRRPAPTSSTPPASASPRFSRSSSNQRATCSTSPSRRRSTTRSTSKARSKSASRKPKSSSSLILDGESSHRPRSSTSLMCDFSSPTNRPKSKNNLPVDPSLSTRRPKSSTSLLSGISTPSSLSTRRPRSSTSLLGEISTPSHRAKSSSNLMEEPSLLDKYKSTNALLDEPATSPRRTKSKYASPRRPRSSNNIQNEPSSPRRPKSSSNLFDQPPTSPRRQNSSTQTLRDFSTPTRRARSSSNLMDEAPAPRRPKSTSALFGESSAPRRPKSTATLLADEVYSPRELDSSMSTFDETAPQRPKSTQTLKSPGTESRRPRSTMSLCVDDEMTPQKPSSSLVISESRIRGKSPRSHSYHGRSPSRSRSYHGRSPSRSRRGSGNRTSRRSQPSYGDGSSTPSSGIRQRPPPDSSSGKDSPPSMSLTSSSPNSVSARKRRHGKSENVGAEQTRSRSKSRSRRGGNRSTNRPPRDTTSSWTLEVAH